MWQEDRRRICEGGEHAPARQFKPCFVFSSCPDKRVQVNLFRLLWLVVELKQQKLRCRVEILTALGLECDRLLEEFMGCQLANHFWRRASHRIADLSSGERFAAIEPNEQFINELGAVSDDAH